MSETVAPVLKAKDYKGSLPPIWCPGCGDFAVLNATQKALAARGIKFEDVIFVSGIGCSSRFPHFMKAYGFHAVHGRALPVATGLRLAMNDPTKLVIVVGGDGDGMAIGGGHFLHAARRNPNITYIMMDNEIYGLTKGQASPTSVQGLTAKTTPYADASKSADQPLNPLALAIMAGASHVSRAYSGAIKELVELIGKAIDHNGYSFVQAVSPCVTFNDIYEKARAEQKTLDSGHDTSNQMDAVVAAMNELFATGVFFENQRQTLDEAVQLQIATAEEKADTGFAGLAMKIRSDAGY